MKNNGLFDNIYNILWQLREKILIVIDINSLFEQKSWKYIVVTSGYWMISLTIMGAIICGWK